MSAFVFGSRIVQICALSQLSVCSHTPTVYSTTISRFTCNIFSEWPLNFFVSTIHLVIWPSPGTLKLATENWFCHRCHRAKSWCCPGHWQRTNRQRHRQNQKLVLCPARDVYDFAPLKNINRCTSVSQKNMHKMNFNTTWLTWRL